MARRKMRDIVTKRLAVYQRKNEEFLARIGNLATGEIFVPNTTRTVYVTMQTSGAVNQAINNAVPNALGRPVVVGYDINDMSKTLRVLRGWNAFGNGENDADGLADHADQHEWGGHDPVYVWWEQVLKSLPVPDGLTLKIYPGEYKTATGWKTYTQRTTLDLSSYVPSTSGKAKYVLVVVDAAGSFAVRDGAEVTGYDNLTDANIPQPSTGDTSICAVRLFYGQTEIRMTTDGPQDIVDLRASGQSWAATYAHDRLHAITSALDHTSTATPGRMLKADANGLPVNATNTDPEVAAAVTFAQAGKMVMIYEDLTGQVDGIVSSFTLGHSAIQAFLHVNGLLEITTMTGSTTAALTFVPTVSDTLGVMYMVTENDILTDDNGIILTDDNGSALFID